MCGWWLAQARADLNFSKYHSKLLLCGPILFEGPGREFHGPSPFRFRGYLLGPEKRAPGPIDRAGTARGPWPKGVNYSYCE